MKRGDVYLAIGIATICGFSATAVRAESNIAVLNVARVFEEYTMTHDQIGRAHV